MWWLIEYSMWSQEIEDYETSTIDYDDWGTVLQFFYDTVKSGLCGGMVVTAMLVDHPNDTEHPYCLTYCP